jgi:hypothetical protein
VSWTGSGPNQPPVPVIDTPASTLRWKVGDPISFTGHANDPEQGQLPASALTWRLVMQHCPSNCHTHPIQTWTGVSSGSFNAPDHEYPSYLELELTATDSGGATGTTTLRLDPRTVVLTFASSPTGLQLAVNGVSSAASFTRTVIVGSTNTLSAATPQDLNGTSYAFASWSDGGAQTHNIVAPATPATYTATYSTTGTPPPGCSSGEFQAHYFSNTTLSGSPVHTACEAAIDYDWGMGSPAGPVPSDQFSARWTGQFTFPAGATTFSATADDGIRLWVDGVLVINAWLDQPATTYTATRTLTAGTHEVKVEYYENGWDAVARVSWTSGSTGCSAGQFQAEYFANTTLSGSPVYSPCEATIDHDWGMGSPAGQVPSDQFSARWTGQFTFPAGATTFSATADDGIRLWVDGVLVINAWVDQPATTYTATRTLTAGTHEVKVEYYENGWDAVARVSWGP